MLGGSDRVTYDLYLTARGPNRSKAANTSNLAKILITQRENTFGFSPLFSLAPSLVQDQALLPNEMKYLVSYTYLARAGHEVYLRPGYGTDPRVARYVRDMRHGSAHGSAYSFVILAGIVIR